VAVAVGAPLTLAELAVLAARAVEVLEALAVLGKQQEPLILEAVAAVLAQLAVVEVAAAQVSSSSKFPIPTQQLFLAV
jgi:hypothetical protein